MIVVDERIVYREAENLERIDIDVCFTVYI